MINDPLPTLSPEAEKAWFAYQAMGKSKQMYFAYLQELDQKKDKNAAPSMAENLTLEKLLKTHDEKVNAFNKAMQKVEEPAARQVLMTRITEAIAAH